MKKWLVILALVAAAVAPVVWFMSSLASVLLFSTSGASQNACVAPVGVVAPLGGPVRWPAAGAFTVTSEYGMRHNPGQINHGQYRLHAGIDLAVSSGQIVAASDGVVSKTPTSATGGNMVEIDHGGGLVTRYLHLASRNVQVGDQVWAGRLIGAQGATGNVDGAHLHFEVTQAGRPTDPRQWLTQQGLTVPPTGGTGTAPAVVLGDPGRMALDPQPALLAPSTEPGATQGVVDTLPEQVGAWRGQQIHVAAQVIKAGQDRSLDAKTITIAVMTAMAESSLENKAHGDAVRADTVGVFQEGPERGPLEQRMDPYSAAGIFYDHLLDVPGYLDLEPTIAAHRAQNNADPYHYERSWPDAVLMVSTLTADPGLLENLPATGPVVGCEDGGPGLLEGTGDGTGQAIVEAATHYVGTPYSWGGGDIGGPTLGTYTSPSLDGTRTVGFDCSGLVMAAVHHATGVTLPHSAEDQGKDARGRLVPRDWSQMRAGDIVSFSEDGSGAPDSFGHVGIYLGGGKMIHAPRPGKSVEIVQLKGSAYFEPMSWNIRRYGA